MEKRGGKETEYYITFHGVPTTKYAVIIVNFKHARERERIQNGKACIIPFITTAGEEESSNYLMLQDILLTSALLVERERFKMSHTHAHDNYTQK